MPAEVELKLIVSPAAVASVRSHPALVALSRGRARTQRVISTYYDTPAWELRRAGVSLRLRREGRQWVQTVKAAGTQVAGLARREEIETRLAARRIDARKLGETAWGEVFEATAGRLKPMFVTDVARMSQALAFPDRTRAILALDSGAIRAGRRQVPVSEIEIELVEGEPRRLFELAHALAADLAVEVAHDSKADRGYALAQGAPPTPLRARTITLAPDISASAALAAVAEDCLAQIAANAHYVARGIDSEFLHQLRVGLRRLRSLQEIVVPLMAQDAIAPIDEELRWCAGVLGPARDWDVFANETLPGIGAHFKEPRLRRQIGQLKARATRSRRGSQLAAREAAASPRLTRLLLLLGSQFTSLATSTTDGPGAASAREFAQLTLSDRARRLKKRAKHLRGASADDRHRARIAAKKLRYAAEFFAPLYSGGRAKAYIGALATLQSALGHLNDLATAARLIEELATGAKVTVGIAHATGIVRGWIARAEAPALADAAKSWRRLAKTRSFWDR